MSTDIPRKKKAQKEDGLAHSHPPVLKLSAYIYLYCCMFASTVLIRVRRKPEGNEIASIR